MSLSKHVVLMATYNEWMNAKLYETAGKLPAEALAADRKAFFGSILGTLNHIVVGDTVWLKRFATHPAHYAALEPMRATELPRSLDQILFTDFAALSARRKELDGIIRAWAASVTEEDLGHTLQYANMKGVPARRQFGSLVMHFFNHQTHHRGQATTLLFQAGLDVGVTDLMALIPEAAED